VALHTCVRVCYEGMWLREDWSCPVDGSAFRTTIARMRSTLVLHEHHLRFMGRGRPAVPLEGRELVERLETLRLRNRGGHQRTRENHRAARGQPVASAPAPQLAGAPASRLSDKIWNEETWDNAAMFDLLLPEDVVTAQAMDVQVADAAAMEAHDHPEWVVVPYVAPLPPEVESLPCGIPVIEYANTVAILSGFSGQSPVALGHRPR